MKIEKINKNILKKCHQKCKLFFLGRKLDFSENDPNENIKEIKKRVLELIKQKMDIRVDQAFEWINNIVLDRDYDVFFRGENFRRVLKDKDNFNRLNEDKQRYLNRVIKKEELTENGYIEIHGNLDKLIEAKLYFEYILLN